MSRTIVPVRPRSVGAGVCTTDTPAHHTGVRWWNSLSEPERRDWLTLAGSACPADAWTLRCQLARGIHGTTDQTTNMEAKR